MATLATLDDVAALAGIPPDASESSPEVVRATRLLELASGLALSFLSRYGVTETTIAGDEETEVEGWEEFRRDALAAIVAEIAAKRMNVSAAANVDPYATGAGPMTLKLNRWEKQSIRELIPGSLAGSSVSVEVERDVSWFDGWNDEEDSEDVE